MLPDREWLTVDEVAAHYHFGREQIRRICRGKIPGASLRATKLRGTGYWRIHRDSAADLLRESQ